MRIHEEQRLHAHIPPKSTSRPAFESGLNILILNTHLPIFPGGGGVEYLTTHNMAALANRVGLVSMAHSRGDLEKVQGLAQAGVDLFLWQSAHLDGVPAPRKHAPLLRALHGQVRGLSEWLKAGRRPIDTVIIDSSFRNMSAELISAMKQAPWQVLAVIESSAAAMIDYVPRPLVSILVMHDIRALMYERQASIAESPTHQRQLLRQARRYYAFERHYCQQYDLVTTVSETDAAWVRQHYQPRQVITVPLPVDAGYFRPDPTRPEVPGRIVFTGLMNHPPNADAACFFARQVLPLVRARQPEVEFFVVGRHPTAEVLALANLPGVTVTGAVPDIRPYLAEAAVVVVPLRYGSGARQKILEAWCQEKCVVSTTIGAEGLAYQDGANLLIADSAEALANGVLRALREPALREQLRRAGRAVAGERHDPPQIAANYYRQIQALAREKVRHDAPMRVALDMRWMIPGMAGGLENLARSFTQQLLALDYYNQYTAILPATVRYDFDLRGHTNVRIVSPDSLRATADRLLTRTMRKLHNRLRLDYWRSPEVERLRFARRLEADIVYSFPGYIMPDVDALRHVVMVADIQHEFFPEFFSAAALEERRRLYGDALNRADHICTISHFSRQTLIEHTGVAPEKVTVLHLAADPIFGDQAHPEHDSASLQKYHLHQGGYLFFPAHTWQHKNHRTAIAALRILRDRYMLKPLLVCSGGAREAQPEIEAELAAHGLAQQVRFLGYVPRADMPALYRGASALLFPSLFEGFGIPLLEAMACGCPVVCSNTTSLPEIAGDAALLVDPNDAEAMASALARVLRDPDCGHELRARGAARVQHFSWRRHTLDTIGVFQQVQRQLRGSVS